MSESGIRNASGMLFSLNEIRVGFKIRKHSSSPFSHPSLLIARSRENFQLIRHWCGDGICNLITGQPNKKKFRLRLAPWEKLAFLLLPLHGCKYKKWFSIQFRFNSRWWRKKREKMARATKRKFMIGNGILMKKRCRKVSALPLFKVYYIGQVMCAE